jgi:hypothetical protein
MSIEHAEEPRIERNAPFFIVGSARSGTTMLRLMLNAHPEVAVPPESRFIVELYTGAEEVETSEFIDQLGRHRRFMTWDLPKEAVREELEDRPRVRFTDAVRAAFRAYAQVNGKVRWGDKTPRYVQHIPLLARLFPDARFIHLVRDGRNVALSYADVPFGPKTITRVARLWSDRVSSGSASGRPLGPTRYIEIHYEDLVEDAEGQAKSLCEYLDLEFDPGMLEYTERSRGAVLPRAARYNPHVAEKPIPSIRSWENGMPSSQVELFEALAGPVLSSLGYPRRFPNPGADARVRAALGRLGVPIGRIKSTRPT